MRTVLALIVLAAAGSVTAADPSVKAYALNLNNPPAGAPKEIVSPAYTGAFLFIQVPGKHVVALDPVATKLSLTDDKGTDLAAKNLSAKDLATDKTKEQARLYVIGSKAPVAGATRVKVKGELVLLCGTGEKTATAEKFSVKEKAMTTAGPAAFEMVLAKDKWSVTMKADGALVKSVAFTDPEGKPLVVPGTINLNFGGGKLSQTATFALPPKTQQVGIKVTHYEKVDPLKLAVDTDTGVGP